MTQGAVKLMRKAACQSRRSAPLDRLLHVAHWGRGSVGSGKSADRGIALEAWPLLTGVLKPGSTGSRYCNSKMKAIQCQQTKTMLAALSNSTRNSTHCVVIPQPGIDGNGSQRGGVTRGDPLAPIPISQSGNTRLKGPKQGKKGSLACITASTKVGRGV
ncbi:uncharacterized protein TRIREDRAFT_111005 [Trichoderma reesei QM6a]|uniref:Predicted protein n=2 Tax=Hypocrea jecorina TaxID=51453 RepID=G0RTI6_HYPJQ|nr:uncharacterized protein TRIREDRAFT_111005 [Trichoderma reesei QM6a]EGR45645.1 predicted protein [Trichoderma reesei QM6a]ETR98706.1 hypothetical protein M419DRAFT_88121 [Trichoderma reesei RUT C-30]